MTTRSHCWLDDCISQGAPNRSASSACTGHPRSAPFAIAARMAAATQSVVAQNGGHHRVFATYRRRQSARRPAGRRRRRSTPDRHGHTRTPCCRGPRRARPNQSRRRPRPDRVPGRPWGCPSRCNKGAFGARPRRPAARASGRPSYRSTGAPSGSRRRRRPPSAQPGPDTASSVRFGCAAAAGPE
jgi:hypothetical protein